MARKNNDPFAWLDGKNSDELKDIIADYDRIIREHLERGCDTIRVMSFVGMKSAAESRLNSLV